MSLNCNPPENEVYCQMFTILSETSSKPIFSVIMRKLKEHFDCPDTEENEEEYENFEKKADTVFKIFTSSDLKFLPKLKKCVLSIYGNPVNISKRDMLSVLKKVFRKVSEDQLQDFIDNSITFTSASSRISREEMPRIPIPSSDIKEDDPSFTMIEEAIDSNNLDGLKPVPTDDIKRYINEKLDLQLGTKNYTKEQLFAIIKNKALPLSPRASPRVQRIELDKTVEDEFTCNLRKFNKEQIASYLENVLGKRLSKKWNYILKPTLCRMIQERLDEIKRETGEEEPEEEKYEREEKKEEPVIKKVKKLKPKKPTKSCGDYENINNPDDFFVCDDPNEVCDVDNQKCISLDEEISPDYRKISITQDNKSQKFYGTANKLRALRVKYNRVKEPEDLEEDEEEQKEIEEIRRRRDQLKAEKKKLQEKEEKARQELVEQQRKLEELRTQQEEEEEEIQRAIKAKEDRKRRKKEEKEKQREREEQERQREEELRNQREREEREEELRKQKEKEERKRQKELEKQREKEEKERQEKEKREEELRKQKEKEERKRQKELEKQREKERQEKEEREEELRKQKEKEEQRQKELEKQREKEEELRKQKEKEEQERKKNKKIVPKSLTTPIVFQLSEEDKKKKQRERELMEKQEEQKRKDALARASKSKEEDEEEDFLASLEPKTVKKSGGISGLISQFMKAQEEKKEQGEISEEEVDEIAASVEADIIRDQEEKEEKEKAEKIKAMEEREKQRQKEKEAEIKASLEEPEEEIEEVIPPSAVSYEEVRNTLKNRLQDPAYSRILGNKSYMNIAKQVSYCVGLSS
jgi:hypothetical protein